MSEAIGFEVERGAVRDAAGEREPRVATAEPSRETATPRLARSYRRRLANLDNVRTALADVFRRLETGDLDAKVARAMVYALSTLAGIMQAQTEWRRWRPGAPMPVPGGPFGPFKLSLEVVRAPVPEVQPPAADPEPGDDP